MIGLFKIRQVLEMKSLVITDTRLNLRKITEEAILLCFKIELKMVVLN